MKLRLKIVATGTYFLETENYRDEWVEHYGDSNEAAEGEIPEQFIIERFQQALEDGDISLDDVLENADIEVTLK